MDVKREYERWLTNATADTDIVAELKTLDSTKVEDAFYRDLSFGTGGLRGIIGAGTSRMNIYTVAKASQGLADYLKKNFAGPSVVIGYDSRIKSDVFAKVAAGVFAANNIKVNIWPVLMPVPTVSFATRYLHTSAGVMVTASHNPSKYNGYKVYGADGCQITTEAAADILAEIEKLDIFADVKTSDFEAGVINGSIQYIPDEVYTAFVDQVKNQSVLFGEEVNKNVAIVYSPLNGTGLKPVTRTLKEMGYTNITVVKEQEQPDGNFPTCPYPNPEIKEAMALGMEYAKKCNADLLLATDPDCDRVGIAVKNKAGEYELLTGNQTGMLLLDYICSQCVKHGKMPADPVMVKTIVTMDMGEQIATNYGLRTINVLTGFKFIGEQIGKLEKQGKADSYVFGFEESYGYLMRDPSYENAVVDRIQHLVHRDKNCSSVFSWSMGNESAYGPNMEKAAAWIKSYDPDRVLNYENSIWQQTNTDYVNDVHDLDVFSRMYAPVEFIDEFCSKEGKKPFIEVEYCHAMGNGPGDLEAYFERLYKYPGYIGGFVWEWCDHSVYMGKTIEGKDKFFYGGDWNEEIHDGNFCMDGLVYPDRTPHTGLLEHKNVARPIRATLLDTSKGLVELDNKLDYTNIKDGFTITYDVQKDGMTVLSGTLDPVDCPAKEKVTITLPFAVTVEANTIVTLHYLQKEDALLTPSGYEAGHDQLIFSTDATSAVAAVVKASGA